MADEGYPVHKEHFEVVLLKEGASEMTALPADFKRVLVEAESTLHALMDAKAQVKGWRPLLVAKPGMLTEPEVLARRRETDKPYDWGG